MPSTEQITLRELLRDKQYKEFFTKTPQLPDHYTPEVKPWRLMILKRDERVWRSKRYGTYGEAFAGLKKVLPISDDAAINCPALSFMPPIKNFRLKGKFDKKGKPVLTSRVWKPAIEADMAPHNWCPHCRRPTVFKMAALAAKRSETGFILPPAEASLRCSICGASERVVDLRNPLTAQKWDPNRPKVY
jgi:hypothetical protein